MATPSKTDAQVLRALGNVAANAVDISSVIDVSSIFAVAIALWIGRTSNSAPTTALNMQVEANMKASGVGFWVPTNVVLKGTTNSITSQAVNGTCNSGQAVISEAATAGNSLSDLVYVKNGTIANGEFGVVKLITTNTSITIQDNLNNAQTGSTVYPNAQRALFSLDTSAIKHLRLVTDNSNNSIGFDIMAFWISLDSIG